ncbi:MAG: hypothetical protein ABIJ47_08110 [Candidatus Bathyarchaeota archaeon]
MEVGISCRRVRVDPAERRLSYIGRLEDVMRVCDRVAADPGGFEEVQMRALDVLIRAVRVCYGLVVDVEELEAEVAALERLEREGRLVGYTIGKPPES